jgi:hypothetical protein
MRQAFYTMCAVLLALAAYAAIPGTVLAGPALLSGQVEATDTALQTVQYGGGGGYHGYDDEYTPPPPPRPRYHHRYDPGWTSDGKPYFRSERFTRDFCYHCARYCDEDGCPRNCWGWSRYCPVP